MKALMTILLVAGIFLALLHEPSFGHGGQYRGPGDGGGPPNTGSGSTKPPPSNSGDSVGPSQPSMAAPIGSGSTRSKGGAGGMQGKKWTAYQRYERWEFWWEYNKDIYLNLKDRLFGNMLVKGSGSFLSGRRLKDEYRTSRTATVDIMKNEVLPFLIDALKIDHPDVQDSSVLAMARITSEEDAAMVIGPIKALLASRYHTVQQSACLSLGVLGSASAIPLCRDLMLDTGAGKKLVGESNVPRLVRSFAALSLGLIGRGEAVPDLVRVIETGNSMTHKDLLSCAITALGLLGDTDRREEIVGFLIRKLTDPEMDPFLKACIPVALGKLGDHKALDDLVRLFSEEDLNEWVRQSTAIAIGQLADLEQDSRIPKLLMDYIKKGRDVKAGHLCFIALAQIGARDRDYSQRQDLHSKLAKFFLSEIDKPSRFSHTAWAALGAAIHAMPHQELHGIVIERIRKKFKDTRNPSNKGAFAISLGLLNADSCARMLYQELLATKDKILQGYLCVGIGLMRFTGAADTIRQLAASDTGFFLRLQASVALGLMGDTKALEVLVKALQDGQTLNIISSAARALGQIGDVSAIGPLKEIVKDEQCQNLSKAFAVVTLGIIGEKTLLPWNARISENCNYLASTQALIEVLDIL